AGAAAELLAHMLGHEPLARDDIESLGDILADLGQLGAATTGTRVRCRVNNAPARQMLRKVEPRRLAPREALHLDPGRRGLALVLARSCGTLLELQLQLIDKPLTALGAWAE